MMAHTALSAALVFAATGCVTVRTPMFLQPAAERQWEPTLERAQALAAEGLPESADTLLARFATANPGFARSVETLYWRALFRLDPKYEADGARDALFLLDAYLASESKIRHQSEAAALRRVAEEIVDLNHLLNIAAGKAQTASRAPPDAGSRATDARSDVQAAIAELRTQQIEIRRLRDELAKSNAELERIKKRLADLQKPPGCCVNQP